VMVVFLLQRQMRDPTRTHDSTVAATLLML
jgi:hypothetical protein